MKVFIFVLFLLFLLCGLSPQFRTHYTPLPAIQRVRRRVWAYRRPGWAIAVAIVRIA